MDDLRQDLVDRTVRDVAVGGADEAARRLDAAMTAATGSPPPPTWVDAVIDEAEHHHRYVVGEGGAQPVADEPVLSQDRAIAWPWDGSSPVRRARQLPRQPLGVARAGAWVLVARAVAWTWTRRPW